MASRLWFSCSAGSGILKRYVASRSCLEILDATIPTGSRTSVSLSMGNTPLHTSSALDAVNEGNTNPGQSASNKPSPSSSVWKCFVLPGVAETPVFLAATNALTVDDLPTFGYPTIPTHTRPSLRRSLAPSPAALSASLSITSISSVRVNTSSRARGLRRTAMDSPASEPESDPESDSPPASACNAAAFWTRSSGRSPNAAMYCASSAAFTTFILAASASTSSVAVFADHHRYDISFSSK